MTRTFVSEHEEQSGVQDLANLLGFAEESLLNNRFQVLSFAVGSLLVRGGGGKHKDSLFLILGYLSVSIV